MKKKKTKNASISGVSQIDEQTLFPVTDDFSTYIEELNADFWERLRRHKKYLKLCKGVKFHPYGIISPSWIQANMDKLTKIKTQAKQLFGIKEIFDPSKESEEFQPGMINTFGIPPIIVKAILPNVCLKQCKV